MLPRIIITLLVAGASAAPADPLLVRSSSKTEYILLQPAAKSEQQYVQLYTVQPKPDATGKEQFVFLYPNQFYYLRDDEENWFTGIQNWWQNQVQGATENSNSGEVETKEPETVAPVSSSAESSAVPSPTTKNFGLFEKSSIEKDEKKFYYLLPSSSINPPQYFRQVNPFQVIPSVRSVFTSPAANPVTPKINYVLAPVALRSDLKESTEKRSDNQPELTVKTPFTLTPVAYKLDPNQVATAKSQPLAPLPITAIPEGINVRPSDVQFRSGGSNVGVDEIQSQPLDLVPMIQQRLAEPGIGESPNALEMANLNLGNNVVILPKSSIIEQNSLNSLRVANASPEPARDEQTISISQQVPGAEQQRIEEPKQEKTERSNEEQNRREESMRSDEQISEQVYEQKSEQSNDESKEQSNDQSNKQNQNEDERRKEEQARAKSDSSIAQARPNSLALAGNGGVASSSPTGTALVGKDGLALSSPSATAVAGDFGSLNSGILSSGK